MKYLDNTFEGVGKTVLVRVDYNVPFVGEKITDATRIESSYATIDFLLKKKARIVLLAHLGKGNESLLPVATFLKKRYKVVFITEPIEEDVCRVAIEHAAPDTIVLLENIRRYPGEEKNNRSFAKATAALGDIYVNDGFSVSHRAHASVVGVPALLPSYAGFQLQKEIEALSPFLMGTPRRPFLFILGGAKFGTKIPLLTRLSPKASETVIAGAILNSFYEASGFEVGASVVDRGYEKEIKKLLSSENILLPIDVVVVRKGAEHTLMPYEVQKGDRIVDIGPQSIALIGEKIKKAGTILWNGPTGWYEKGFTKGTLVLAEAIATSKAMAVIGGGDTGAVIQKTARGKKNIFVSTGGGATLDFLAEGTLPGIAALK